MPDQTNKAKFLAAYRTRLEEAHRKHPDQYTWPIEMLDAVYARMADAIERGSHNKDSHAFRNACRDVGIKHTYKAIHEFIAA